MYVLYRSVFLGVARLNQIIHLLKQAIRKERDSLTSLEQRISEDSAQIVNKLLACKGRIAISGIGKAGLIARKISATFASTGSRSYWLDPVSALHGDLGMTHPDDIAILISNSGSTGEIILAAEAIGHLGIKRIALTKDKNTPLAQMSEFVLELGDYQEACPLKLAPTCSTTAILALGDALAVTLQQLRGFSQTDYSKFHPSGALGRRLNPVSKWMRSNNRLASVGLKNTIADAVHEITAKRCGLCVVVDQQGKLAGVFTDGDFRRCWEKGVEYKQAISKVLNSACKSIKQDILVEDALKIMRKFKINALPVVNDDNQVIGLLDIQDVV